MTLGLVVRSVVLVLLLSQVGAAAPARQSASLVLVYEENRLSIRRSASVPYSDLVSLLAAVRRASLAGQYAVVHLRDSPRELVGYVLAVDRDGTLSLGSQHHGWEPGDRAYRFLGGELYRSYQPLEGTALWTWLVTIPVSREREASLVIRAGETRWPIRSVSIAVSGQPAD